MAQTRSVRSLPVEYGPALVEEAVLSGVRGFREEFDFRRSRNRIYTLPEGEERERRFQEFHSVWFVRMRLGCPITAALEEQPILLQQAGRCCIFPARSALEEGADLHQWSAGKLEGIRPEKTILIRMKPARLLEPSSLQSWLRHELMHVADMLDPAFGYDPQCPDNDAGAVAMNLLRERYRVLWDTWIDGRLFRRGWLPQGGREKRREEFLATFSAVDLNAAEKFEEIFLSDAQTHAGLIAFAENSGIRSDPARFSRGKHQPCPLCRFPTYQLLDGTTELLAETLLLIKADFPTWRPEHGLCLQCADLYRAMEMSRSAEALLPRI